MMPSAILVSVDLSDPSIDLVGLTVPPMTAKS